MSGQERIVIVGAGPAGFSAARAYREADGAAEVLMLAAEAHHPYSRPPLTKEYLRSEHGRADLFMEDPGFYAEHGIELRTQTAAAELDIARRVIHTDSGEELGFGSCVLATGSEPVRLPVPGGDHDDLITVRELEDSERLQSQAAPGAAVTVVGSGFIGCEAAASLAMRGADVSVLATAWPEYRALTAAQVRGAMKQARVIDPTHFLAAGLANDPTIAYVAAGRAA